MLIKTKNIEYREDLYPRFKPDHKTIEKYSQSIEFLPPIKIDQHNILIDGFHRWKAHELAEIPEIKAEVIKVESEKELKKLAYQYNSIHGLQLSNPEKKKFADEMISELSLEEISKIISVPISTLSDWTKDARKRIEEERNRKIIELYLKAENTQQTIAERMELTQQQIAKIIENTNNSEIVKNCKPSKILLYNIWNQEKADKDTSHFGYFQETFMENLLWYHTQPFDIVFDPFAGTGTTVDICQKMYRRYFCTDKIVKPGRENDIYQHDIITGLPENLPKPDFAFLDPPYWKQAEGMYSKDKNDLGNMNLDKFYESMLNLINQLAQKKVNKIAIVIQPTQYKNNMVFEDHIFKFHEMLFKKYEIEMRYILPYSTQQYNAQMVDKAKEKNICLTLNRDLIIWKLK